MKTALVTGGTRGIGLAVAQRLAEAGWRLALAYRGDEAAAARVAGELTARGVPHALFQADLADPVQARSLPGRVAEQFGGLDALVANAGIVDDGVFLVMERERYERVLQTNLFSTMRLVGAALPLLRRGHEPAVVMLSSLGGVFGKEGQVAYATSKGGLIGFTQWLGHVCSASGIRVNAVAPGFIDTDMTRDLDARSTGHIVRGTALQRTGRAGEVAEAVEFLLQPGYIQSTTLRVDGGFNR